MQSGRYTFTLFIVLITRLKAAAVPALYAGITLVLMRPLLPRISAAFPHDAGDPLLNTWILSWNARTIPFSSTWWNAPSFYPLTGMSGLTELLVSLNLLASPIIWLTGKPVLAYNILFLLSFPLSAWAAYLLCFELTDHRPAAILGGLAFGFSPYRIDQLPHLQVLASFWMPMALLALHRFLRTRRHRWLLAFAGLWLLQALSNGYYMLFFSLLVGAWMLWFLARPHHWRPLRDVAAALVVVVALVSPLLLSYQTIQQHYGLERNLDEILFYSGDVTSFLTPSRLILLWGWFQRYAHPEGALFPGITVFSLAGLGVAITLRKHCAAGGRSPARVIVGGAALVAVFVSASVLIFGPWRIEIGGLRLLSVTRFHKPFSVFVLFGLLYGLLGPTFRHALRGRSAAAFYVIATLLIAVASLGPEPRLLGERILYKPPYALLLSLPGFGGLRVPTRFWMLGTLTLAVTAAFAFARLAPHGTRGRLATWAVGLGILLDGWPSSVPLAAAPWTISCLSRPTTARAFLQLPIGDIQGDLSAMYRAADRGIPSINGYSGYYPPHYHALIHALNRRSPDILKVLASRGPLEVAVDTSPDTESWLRYLRAIPGAREYEACAGSPTRVFALPAVPAPSRALASGTPATILFAKADINNEFVGNVIDGSLTTRWESGLQTRPHRLTLFLGAPKRLRSIQLSLGRSTEKRFFFTALPHGPSGPIVPRNSLSA